MHAEQPQVNLEPPNLVTILADRLKGSPLAGYLHLFENVIFSLIIVCILSIVAYLATRKKSFLPSGLQNVVEAFVEIIDNFVCGILGHKGRRYTPFIGTLFIYILCMNLSGLIPFLKSSTSSWSTTLALALCVFLYVQYSAFRQMGFLGYMDHLAEKPRGFMAFTVVIPILIFLLHLLSEFLKPISLSLRLRSNIWGDDFLLSFLATFGAKGIPLLVFNMLLVIIAGLVQALVFSLLSTIYFALVMESGEKEEEHNSHSAS